MPAKAKVTKEMIVDAAFEVAREAGAETINVRMVSNKLNCSTQPVMYHFATMEELKRAAYEKADAFHTEYLMNVKNDDVLLGIGLNYIRFAIGEPNLFRFLFQSGYAKEHSLLDMVNSEELTPVLELMSGAMGRSVEQTREIFVTLSMFVHGYASIIANNGLEYDEEIVSKHLDRAYRGIILAMKEEMK